MIVLFFCIFLPMHGLHEPPNLNDEPQHRAEQSPAARYSTSGNREWYTERACVCVLFWTLGQHLPLIILLYIVTIYHFSPFSKCCPSTNSLFVNSVALCLLRNGAQNVH